MFTAQGISGIYYAQYGVWDVCDWTRMGMRLSKKKGEACLIPYRWD